MKKILILLIIVAGIMSCENKENEFPDFDAQAVYFPYQYPVRTIILGESRSDNSIDLDHAFSVGVAIGGMYKNTQDRIVDIALDTTLLDSVAHGGGFPADTNYITAMPDNYYTATFNQITIPSGSFSGKMRVDLTDAFFEDTLSAENTYVFPLAILPTTEDSVLTGKAYEGLPSINIHNEDHWETGKAPKHFTLFMVKFINEFHGAYFNKGMDMRFDSVDAPLVSVPVGDTAATTNYSTRFLVENRFVNLTTRSLTESYLTRFGEQDEGGNYKMKLTFDPSSQDIVIDSVPGFVGVFGTGSYLDADDAGALQWGGKPYRTLFLDYVYRDGNDRIHHVMDTLVYRDNAVVFEEFDIAPLGY